MKEIFRKSSYQILDTIYIPEMLRKSLPTKKNYFGLTVIDKEKMKKDRDAL